MGYIINGDRNSKRNEQKPDFQKNNNNNNDAPDEVGKLLIFCFTYLDVNKTDEQTPCVSKTFSVPDTYRRRIVHDCICAHFPSAMLCTYNNTH